MTSVNPFTNNYGWCLLVYISAGQSWTTSNLNPSQSLTLVPDGRVRNIWDPVQSKIVAVSNRDFRSSPTEVETAWRTANPKLAGDFSTVNILVVNDTPVTLFTESGSSLSAQQTTGLSLPLGLVRLGTNTGQSTDFFQVGPWPDQIIVVEEDLSITITSRQSLEYPTSKVTLHNCYSKTLIVRQTKCEEPTGQSRIQIIEAQNLGLISASSILQLTVRSNYQILLQNNNSTTTSGFYSVPPIGDSSVFFRSDGSVSTTSCSLDPLHRSQLNSIQSDINNTTTSDNEQNNDNAINDWWFIIVVITIAILIIIVLYFAQDDAGGATKETADRSSKDSAIPVSTVPSQNISF